MSMPGESKRKESAPRYDYRSLAHRIAIASGATRPAAIRLRASGAPATPRLQGSIMKTTLVRALAIAAAVVTTAFATLPSQAQDVRREDMVTYFQMDHIDKDKDGMVSKKEFMDMMGKAWDEMAAKTPEMKGKDRMTLEQYRAFAKMFNLDIGA
jgi:hypothetical protein